MDGLTETDKEILKLLATYKTGSSAYIISRKIHRSTSNVLLRLRILTDRAIVKKRRGIYVLEENVKYKLVEYGILGKKPQTKPIKNFISGGETAG